KERTQIRSKGGDACDEAERHRIRQAEDRTDDAGGDADETGDQQLSAYICVEHRADLAPDLIEVCPVVAGNEAAQVSAKRGCLEREQERDDEHQQQLERGGQRRQPESHSVAELAEEIV